MECRQSSCEPPGQFSPDTATVTRTHCQFVAGLLVLLVILLAGCGTPAPAVTAVTPTPVVDAVSPVAALVEGSDVEVPGSSPAPRPTQTPIHKPWPSSTASSTPTATPTVAPSHTATPTATPTPTPQHTLAIDYMRRQTYPGSEIAIEEELEPGANYDRYIASYQSEGLTIYALLTVPRGQKPQNGWPVIVFNHGYILPGQYRTTERYRGTG